MQWDDLKVFLYVARRRKLSVAAKDLKLDETTISRRIKRLEIDLGQTLFERLRSGHHLTAHGETLFAEAEEIERRTDSIRVLRGSEAQKPSGILRISVAEGFGAQILAPALGEFCDKFADIEIDLVSGSGFLSLSKREADVAIGLVRSKSKHISSEPLSGYSLHLYGSRQYIKKHPAIQSLKDLQAHTFIDYVDDLIYSDELRYFEEFLPNFRPRIRSTSIVAQKRLVQNGAGLAILPDFLASDELIKILPNEINVKRQFWFSCHQSVASLAKVKVFKNFVTSIMNN